MEPAGTFNEPQQSSEAELCSNNVRRVGEKGKGKGRERERERD